MAFRHFNPKSSTCLPLSHRSDADRRRIGGEHWTAVRNKREQQQSEGPAPGEQMGDTTKDDAGTQQQQG